MNVRWIAAASVLLLFPVPAAAAGLYLSPAQLTPAIGEPLQIAVFADSAGASINAAEAEITFDPNTLQIQSVSTEASALSVWSTTPTFSNTDGTLLFSGWTNIAFTGVRTHLLTIVFIPLKIASGSIDIRSGTLLANDGQETNVITRMTSAAYTTVPAHIVPDQPVPTSTPAQASTSVSVEPTREERVSVDQQQPLTSPVSVIPDQSDQVAAAASADGGLLIDLGFVLLGIALLGFFVGYVSYRFGTPGEH